MLGQDDRPGIPLRKIDLHGGAPMTRQELTKTLSRYSAGLLTLARRDPRLRARRRAERMETALNALAALRADISNDPRVTTPLCDRNAHSEGLHFLVVAVPRDALDNIQAAFARAGELGPKTLSHQLDLICTDFLATNDFGKPGDPAMLGRFLSKLEVHLGVRLIALDQKTDLPLAEGP